MKAIQIIISLLAINVQLLAQTDWKNYLEGLNGKDTYYQFVVEKGISGKCFLMLGEEVNYYQDIISLDDKAGKEILRIEFDDSLGLLTTFKGIVHSEKDGYNNAVVDSSNLFNPWLYYFQSDYFGLALECIDTTGPFYTVILNENTTLEISKLNKQFKKVSIESYISMRISYPNGVNFNRQENPLRKDAQAEADIIGHSEQTRFTIWNGQLQEIKGDWIKIKTISGEVGWIKWKQGDSLLIQFENV